MQTFFQPYSLAMLRELHAIVNFSMADIFAILFYIGDTRGTKTPLSFTNSCANVHFLLQSYDSFTFERQMSDFFVSLSLSLSCVGPTNVCANE